jgi:template-activating factor I
MQHFKENPYFSDSVLKKEFKHKNPSSASDETADKDGITASMLNFSWETDVQQSVSAYCPP